MVYVAAYVYLDFRSGHQEHNASRFFAWQQGNGLFFVLHFIPIDLQGKNTDVLRAMFKKNPLVAGPVGAPPFVAVGKMKKKKGLRKGCFYLAHTFNGHTCVITPPVPHYPLSAAH